MLRNHDEDGNLFTMGEGCALHGEEFMRECASCGTEFCRACHLRTLVCPDCAESGEEEDDKRDPDAEDLKDSDLPLDLSSSPPPGGAEDEEQGP